MEKVLVTGGCGFIGSHIVEELINSNYEVVVIDNLSTGKIENIDTDKVEFFQCDILSEDFGKIVSQVNPTYIIHQAAQVSVAESVKNIGKDTAINIQGSVNVIEAAKSNNVKKIVFASSAAVYGEPNELPIPVEHQVSPQSPYGLSKLTVEKYLELAQTLYGIDYTILRYSNVYGPRQDAKGEGGVVAIFTDRANSNEAPFIYGDGEQTRDFIFVKDVAKANVASLTKANNKILNISTNTSISVNELFNVITEIAGVKLTPIYENERTGDIKHSRLDNQVASESLGLEFDTNLAIGIKATLEYRK
ncbi:NAD-dependent epimerase/dehydratase family protein [Gottfriedia acidiceleris]|uniref:NAD-dependent epimerase/dehydratase family protein n=1 Tax=Gottfriedia acidiceleris TaxID=371036 RepID=UPI003000000C